MEIEYVREREGESDSPDSLDTLDTLDTLDPHA